MGVASGSGLPGSSLLPHLGEALGTSTPAPPPPSPPTPHLFHEQRPPVWSAHGASPELGAPCADPSPQRPACLRGVGGGGGGCASLGGSCVWEELGPRGAAAGTGVHKQGASAASPGRPPASPALPPLWSPVVSLAEAPGGGSRATETEWGNLFNSQGPELIEPRAAPQAGPGGSPGPLRHAPAVAQPVPSGASGFGSLPSSPALCGLPSSPAQSAPSFWPRPRLGLGPALAASCPQVQGTRPSSEPLCQKHRLQVK